MIYLIYAHIYLTYIVNSDYETAYTHTFVV